MSRLNFATSTALIVSAITVMCALLLACRAAGENQSTQRIAEAQAQVGFRIRVPMCFPDSVNPESAQVTVESDANTGFHAVHLDHAYLVRPTYVPGNFGPAVAITEGMNRGGDHFLLLSGTHRTLDGIEVVVGPPQLAPTMEWIQDGVTLEIVTTLSQEDMFRIFHSMATGKSGCSSPSVD